MAPPERSPRALYALPILLGVVGSLIGWIAVRHDYPQMGRRMWVIGCISSAIWSLIYIVVLPLILLVGATDTKSDDSVRPATVLECEEEITFPFTLLLPENGEPQITSSRVLTRGESESVCGGLMVDFRGGASGFETIMIIVEIQNQTSLLWQGTVQVTLENHATIPVAIERVPANELRKDDVEFSVKRGTTQEIQGSLLIGP